MSIINVFNKLISRFRRPKYWKLPDQRTIFWDIDNTLIRWDFSKEERKKFGIEMSPGVWMVPHRKHIHLLKSFHATGLTNVLWSAGGSNWAAQAAKILKIESYITAILSKPTWYVDDLSSDEFMSDDFRIYKKDWEVDQDGLT